MKINNINIYNMYSAVLGIRNSFKSKEKSDSTQVAVSIKSSIDGLVYDCNDFEYLRKKDRTDLWTSYNGCVIGKEDEKMIKRILTGQTPPQERKFLRQILVSMDIIGSIKFYSQHDTFKIATVRNSESTMHSITKGGLSQEDFEREINFQQLEYINSMIESFNGFKEMTDKQFKRWSKSTLFNKGVEKNIYLKELFEKIDANLPAGYLLESHWTGNYENMRNIYHSRKNHKMYWWKEFCDYIKKLPYAELLITDGE